MLLRKYKLKLDMNASETRKWIATVVASSESDVGPESKFQQLVASPEWNPKEIDFRIVMNGVEFTELEDFFDRLDEHVMEAAAEMSGQGALTLAKIEAIQNIINAQSVEEFN